MNTGLALEERERFLSRDARGSVGYRRTGWRDVGQVEVVLQMPVRRRSSCPRQLRQKSGCSRIWLKELRSLRTRSCFLLRFQPFLFCSKALSTQSTHGGERLVDRKRLMRNPRVWFYRQTRTLDFQIGLFCFVSGPERVGCKNRKPGRIDTDRAATGAGQFVLSGKNGRSSRLRSFGPPLREER